MASLHALSNAGAPIPQAALEDLGKSSIKLYFSQDHVSLDLGVVQRFWQTLVTTVSDISVRDKYLTTACNVVAVFLLQASSSPNPDIQRFGLSEKVWFEGLNCAQVAFYHAKTKPALQVVETCSELISRLQDGPQAVRLVESACVPFVKIIVLAQPESRIKEACTTLSCFIKKSMHIIRLEATLEACFQQVSRGWTQRLVRHNIDPNSINDKHPLAARFILAVLFCIEDLATRSAALKLLGHVCHRGTESLDSPAFRNLCAETIELYLQNNEDVLNEFADNIFPLILDNREQYDTFVRLYSLAGHVASENRVILLLAVLRVGRLKNFLTETNLLNTLETSLSWSISISNHNLPVDAIRRLLKSANANVRIKAYNLLTTSPTTNAPIPPVFLHVILDTIRHLHDDNDAHQRGEILSTTRRFVKRLEASAIDVQKPAYQEPGSEKTCNTSQTYSSFIRAFVRFLGSELGPAISYQRHVIALLTLQLVLGLCNKYANNAITSDISRTLANLVLDPYDDVREIATNLCERIAHLGLANVNQIITTDLSKSVAMLSATTNRSDHADAAGRFCAMNMAQEHSETVLGPGHSILDSSPAWVQIVGDLEHHLGTCQELRPGSSFPLHGSLLALVQFINRRATFHLQSREEDINRLVTMCHRIWLLVQPQLCVDSPETSSDDADDDTVGGPKDLLAYSWRALRDSSLLLQAVLRLVPSNEEVLRLAGALCTEQLTKLRHRGAFSTVAQTFNLCCEQARLSEHESLRALNKFWYQLALVEIDRQSTKLTRRSAGLPAMFTAILDTNDVVFFSDAIKKLVDIAQRTPEITDSTDLALSLPQVHAMNSLKDIMTTSKFRAISEKHISELMELAVYSLSSGIWAIRNCGLMLLRSCMNRLDQSFQQQFVFFKDGMTELYSSLKPIDIATKMLERGVGSHVPSTIDQDFMTADNIVAPQQQSEVSENTFAALELIGHLYNEENKNDRLFQLIKIHLHSSIWAIRDHAARLLAKISSFQEMYHAVDTVMAGLHHSFNYQHGVFLFCRYYLHDHWHKLTLGKDLDGVRMLFTLLQQRVREDALSFTTAAVMDIINDTYALCLDDPKLYAWLAPLLTSDPKVYTCEDRDLNFVITSRLALNMFYQMVLLSRDGGQTSVPISQALVVRLVAFPDDAKYVTGNMFKIKDPQFVAFATSFAIEMLSEFLPADVQTLCMETVSTLLTRQRCLLTEEQTSKLHNIIQQIQTYGRQLRNERLLLQAHLLASQLVLKPNLLPLSLLIDLASWITDIQLASRDYLEFSTRMKAINAVSTCGLHVVRSQALATNQDGAQIQLQLLSIVYDQLNDDDEDIREAATMLAMEMIDDSAVSTKNSSSLCPLAAREALLEIMFDKYGDSANFGLLALTRVIGQLNIFESLEISDAAAAFHTPVVETLMEVCDRLKDLFAEEKQNLYIDEIDEIEKWSLMLRKCSRKHFSAELVVATATWVSEGLQQLAHLHEQESIFDFQSPLGVTYQSDILIIYLRLIHLAAALSRIPCDEDTTDQKFSTQLLRNTELLKQIRTSCEAADAHPKVMQALDQALYNT